MSVSFGKATIYEYLFDNADVVELSYDDIQQFIEQIRSEITSTSTFSEVIVRDDNVDDKVFAELDDKVICTDCSSMSGISKKIEQRYDDAYGTSMISSAMRQAKDDVIAAATTRKATAHKTSFNGKIFCLMGKSASGKDSVYALLRGAFDSLGLRQLVMYSTRPQRVGEIDGHEYNFISTDELNALEDAGRVIERRDYSTMYGTWSYAIVDDEQLLDEQSYVIKEETPQGVEKLIEHFGHEHVFPIYIYVEDGVRLLRALSREMGQDVPKYDEVCRRYLSDCDDFAEVDAADEFPRFVNDNLEKCATDIEQYIAKTLGKN